MNDYLNSFYNEKIFKNRLDNHSYISIVNSFKITK